MAWRVGFQSWTTGTAPAVGEPVEAMTKDERNRFLTVAAEREPDAYPAFMLMALAGLCRGEAIGLWASVDLQASRLHVQEQVARR